MKQTEENSIFPPNFWMLFTDAWFRNTTKKLFCFYHVCFAPLENSSVRSEWRKIAPFHFGTRRIVPGEFSNKITTYCAQQNIDEWTKEWRNAKWRKKRTFFIHDTISDRCARAFSKTERFPNKTESFWMMIYAYVLLKLCARITSPRY